MKFKIRDRVFYDLIQKNCLVIGTKEDPYVSEFDPYNRKIPTYPDDNYDYLLFIEKSKNEEDNVGNYSGMVSAKEQNLRLIQ